MEDLVMARGLTPFIFLFFICPHPAAVAEEKLSPETLLKKAAAVLPELDGDISFPALIHAARGVEIVRDRYGIPHIFADDDRDLFFAQGFVAAQDRLFQIDWWRRVGNGETAEVLGKEALEADRFARLIKYRG